METENDCRKLLEGAGWAVSASHALGTAEPEYLVLGANGSHTIEARGKTPLDAWLDAVEQARALGMD